MEVRSAAWLLSAAHRLTETVTEGRTVTYVLHRAGLPGWPS